MIPTSKLKFWTLLITVLTCVSIGNTAFAEDVIYQYATSTASGYGFGLGIVTETVFKFSATTSMTLSRMEGQLKRNANMNANSCVRAMLYATSSGAPGTLLQQSVNCVTRDELTTSYATTSFDFANTVLTPDDYYLGYVHEGTTGACGGVCLTTLGGNTLGAQYFRNGGAWTYNTVGTLDTILYGVAGGAQSIAITSPTNGANISGNSTTVNINYSNPNSYSEIDVCTYFPASMYLAQGQNPCENGGEAFSIGSEGTISYIYTNTSGTSTRRIAVGFGPTLNLIPSGMRYYDYDYAYFGFHVPASTASSTFGLEENGSSTVSVYGLGSAFTNWNLLQTKYPLNWIFESYTILAALGTATTTIAMPDATITFTAQSIANLGYGQPATSSRTQTFFGTSTIQNVASVPGWSNLRTLESWFLWIGLVMWVWHRKDGLLVIKQGS